MLEAKDDPDFIDLTDSRFHQNGFIPPAPIFLKTFEAYINIRSYEPDSRGSFQARRTLKNFYQAQGYDCKERDFILTAGTSEAYSLIFRLFCPPDKKVLLPNPGYPLFEQLVQFAGLKSCTYKMAYNNGWQIDAESLPWDEDVGLCVMITPNNPTGQILNKNSIDIMAQFCSEKQIAWVWDEVFDIFLYTQTDLPRIGSYYPDLPGFTLNGISKRFGCPDLKLAWIGLTGNETWKKQASSTLELMNDAFLSANSYSQFLLPSLFDGLKEFQQEMVKKLFYNRNLLAEWLEKTSQVSGILPSGGIHGLIKFNKLDPIWDDEQWVIHLLKTSKIFLHPGYFYDIQEEGVWCIYSLINTPGKLAQGLKRISTLIKA